MIKEQILTDAQVNWVSKGTLVSYAQVHYCSSISWLTVAAQVLNSHGIDGADALAEAGISRAEITSREGKAPIEVIGLAWRIVAEKTCDPAIGVRAGFGQFNPAHWQSLGLALLCSTTMRQALNRLVRYFEMLSNAADICLEEDAKSLRFVALPRSAPEVIGYEAMEFGLAAILGLMRGISPRPLNAIEIQLTRPKHFSNGDFEQLFGCSVIFGSECESISFPLSLMDEQLPSGNTNLASYQDSFSEEYMARFGSNSTSLRVKKEILRLLPVGQLSLAKIANSLHTSERNLQRRLHDERTSFQELVVGLRKQLALIHINQHNKSLIDVAYLLGFADHSGFTRAFRDWFGMTPSEYRKSRRP